MPYRLLALFSSPTPATVVRKQDRAAHRLLAGRDVAAFIAIEDERPQRRLIGELDLLALGRDACNLAGPEPIASVDDPALLADDPDRYRIAQPVGLDRRRELLERQNAGFLIPAFLPRRPTPLAEATAY